MLDMMPSVLTLISPTIGGLSNDIVDQAANVIHHSGATLNQRDWLSDGEACDLYFSGAKANTIDQALRQSLGGVGVDMAIQQVQGRQKKLLLSDMDSTIVTAETLDELADHAGLKEKISAITARAMNGDIRFRDALAERVVMLRGLSSDTLAATMERITYSPGAETLVRTMSAHGAYTALVSGGFQYFTTRVKAALGFDFDAGNDIEIIDGKLTGNVQGDIVTKDVKREILIRLAKQQDIDITETLSVGDGANDLPMIMEAGTGVAYHAKPTVVASAPFRIDYAGLDALLFMQGYRRDQFVA